MLAGGLAEIVKVEADVGVVFTGFGEKLDDVLCGSPEMLSVTVLVPVPETCGTLTVTEVLDLRVTVIVPGSERLKSPAAALTVREKVAVCEMVPLVPEIVSEKAPAGALLMVRFDVVEPGGVTELAEKLQFAPLGQFVTDSDTGLLNPFNDVTVIVEPAGFPCVIVCDDGLAESEKSGVEVPQPANLKDPICVLQLNEPFDFRYSLMYQNVQSSAGSTLMLV